MLEPLRSYVGGQWLASAGAETLEARNPSDRRDLVAIVPAGADRDVAAATAAAAEALDAWRRLPGPVRAEHLHRWAAAIAADAESIAATITREVGKPISEARGEVGRASMILRFYAGEAVRALGDVIPAQAPGVLQYTRRDPLGVVALITPWNFPFAIPLWKAAPALAFGNTVVLKPSELSSQVATLLARTAETAGLPPGVFNVVLGSGAAVGSALVNSAAVRGVSFTGSGAVGKQVAAAAVARNIPFQTEMGGKNVAIVLADADLAHAAGLIAAGAMRYAGQKCTATSRVVIDRAVEPRFLDALRAQVAQLPIGPVTDATAAVGPMISARARASVQQALDACEGERCITADLGAGTEHGNFLAPVVLRGVDREAAVAQRELFGPVLVSFVAEDVEEALAIANDTGYGLSASLFTRDLGTAMRYVDRIEAGMVRVNGDTTGVDPHAPFGGMKGSSSGSREQGTAARDFYTETRTVQIHP